MPRVCYKETRFSKRSMAIILLANQIIDEYMADGFNLTLRQLYYQFVARDFLPNTQQSYKNLGSIIAKARMAGLLDWRAIEDRTRNLRGNAHWSDPAQIIRSARVSYLIDLWKGQEYRPEVWIEKDALAGVLIDLCSELDVGFFSCRGYTSLSEMWAAGQRFNDYISKGQQPVIIHLGDHDPSGLDMTRDIADRLDTFCGHGFVRVDRQALNWDQVQKHNPPPNPAKVTDSRAKNYIAQYGSKSWELDALEPRVLRGLVKKAVLSLRDQEQYRLRVEKLNTDRGRLNELERQAKRIAAKGVDS